jgi:hypothetical protein
VADYDSLVLSGFGELSYLIGHDGAYVGRVDSDDTDPDFGSPVPITQAIVNALLDGAVIVGDGTDNRELALPLVVDSDDPDTRAATVERLALAVARPFTLIWTPAGSTKPVVFDCFRAHVEVDWNSIRAGQGAQQITVTIPAFPYARSLELLTPTAGGAVNPLVIDEFDTAARITASNPAMLLEGSFFVSGAGALKQVAGATMWTQTPAAPLNLGAFGVIEVLWAYALGASGSAPAFTRVRLRLDNLADGSGNHAWVDAASPMPGTSYAPLQWDLTKRTNVGAFDINTVRRVRVDIDGPDNGATVYWDKLRALPSFSGAIAATSGWVRIDGVQGSARTPVNLSITAASNLVATLIHRKPKADANYNPILTNTAGAGAGAYSVPATGMAGQFALIVRPGTITGAATGPTVITATVGQQSVSTVIPQGAAIPALIPIGILSLPAPGVAPENVAATSAIAVSKSAPGFSVFNFGEAYLVDVEGETLLIDNVAKKSVWIDAPDPTDIVGRVYTGNTRATASAPNDIRGDALFLFDPGTNYLLIVATGAAAGVTVAASYYSRHQGERP